MGIYLHSDRNRDQNTIVVINPIKRLPKRFQKARKDRSVEAEDVLSLAFSTAIHKWPAHLDYLEGLCNQLVSATSISL